MAVVERLAIAIGSSNSGARAVIFVCVWIGLVLTVLTSCSNLLTWNRYDQASRTTRARVDAREKVTNGLLNRNSGQIDELRSILCRMPGTECAARH